MATILKTERDWENARASGRVLADAFREVKKAVAPGVSAAELDAIARKAIADRGGVCAFLRYTPEGASYPYPAALCVSVNEEVVHGIPRKETILKKGDIVGLDLGVSYKGFITDMAETVAVGDIDKKSRVLLSAARDALREGVAAARSGARVGDISAAIERVARARGVRVVRDLGGHGVGKKVHESPFIPNFGSPGAGARLKEGMMLALEPIFAETSKDISLLSDGYTFVTAAGDRSAHFEHTIVVTARGGEILTR